MAIGVAVGLLLANAFFVAAEFALLASRRSRLQQLEQEGHRSAGRAVQALRRLTLMLAGAQLGITMASIGLGAVAEPALAHLFEDWFHALGLPERLSHLVAFTVALSIVVLLHMVVGEMAPKSWAISAPERSAMLLVRPFTVYVRALQPVIWSLNVLANGVVRLMGVQPQDERALVHGSADLARLLEESVVEGTLAPEDAVFLSRAIRLSGLDAETAMTPRTAIVAVPATATIDEVEDAARRSGHRRILVHEPTGMDDVSGVLHVRDLLLLDGPERLASTARSLVKPVLAVHERRPLEDVLLDMQAQRNRFAVVVDELGTVAGVVTLQDVLESLVSQVADHPPAGEAERSPQGPTDPPEQR
jgi:CBS domain containing-hemolysin-like protein